MTPTALARDSFPFVERSTLDDAFAAARARFEAALGEIGAAAGWSSPRVASTQTAYGRLVHLVVQRRGAVPDVEAVVGSIEVTPSGGHFTIATDVSGEESGVILFEAEPRSSDLTGLQEALVQAAEAVVGWFRQHASRANG